MLFHAVTDGCAVLRNTKNGVFRQAKLFERDNELFASFGSGFIRLMKEGRTSSPTTLWEYVDVEYSAPIRVSGGLRYERKEQSARPN